MSHRVDRMFENHRETDTDSIVSVGSSLADEDDSLSNIGGESDSHELVADETTDETADETTADDHMSVSSHSTDNDQTVASLHDLRQSASHDVHRALRIAIQNPEGVHLDDDQRLALDRAIARTIEYIGLCVGRVQTPLLFHSALHRIHARQKWATEYTVRTASWKASREDRLPASTIRRADVIALNVAGQLKCAQKNVYPFALAIAANLPCVPTVASVPEIQRKVYGGESVECDPAWPPTKPMVSRQEFTAALSSLSDHCVLDLAHSLGLHTHPVSRPTKQPIASVDIETGSGEALPVVNADIGAFVDTDGGVAQNECFVLVKPRRRGAQSRITMPSAQRRFVRRAVASHLNSYTQK